MLLTTTMAMPLSSETDKLALLTLKDKLTNGDSNVLPSWNESLHFCEWQGVTCGRRHKRVSALHLQNQDLGGTLAPSLGNLTFLKKLNLTDLNLYGQIPRQVGRLKRLQILSFQQNHLHGEVPRDVGRLKSLYALELTRNNLQGEIPMELINCSSLKKIDLSYNNLTGKVPSWFGSMMQLTMLELGFNNLVGNIPPTLGNLSSLDTLYLAGNNLEGQVPIAFYNLSNLQVLDISNNKLVGPISSNLHLAFPNLSVLLLHQINSLTTSQYELGACSALTELYLDATFFHGNIPSFLGSLRSLEFLGLSNNSFSGTIPYELEKLTQLNALDLSNNQLYGKVPLGGIFSNITAISLIGNKDLCGGIPQLNFPPCPKLPSNKHKSSPQEVTFLPSLEHKYLRVSYGELHQATNGFSSSNLVGTGSFGSVYRGTLVHFERPVAVKVLNLQTRGASKSFMAECKALGKIKHRNLINILTCCSSVDYKGDDFKAIVFEFMPNGSLETLLHHTIEDSESTNPSLNLMQRVNIALDVAFALDYLHNDLEEAVVHCDIKPSNILLDDDMVAHLGDFGLARLVHGVASHSSSDKGSSSVIKGTIGYVPPDSRLYFINY
ncbi:putative LRR receptor-like serine/threonine-protein kinase [Arachis hypogaea]|nr:putative LRR receptor-like serine/threonine-protein kinase [Arachis hypogaea]